MVAALAARAGQMVASAAPSIKSSAMKKLQSATGNAINSPESIKAFIGGDSTRARVVVTNMAAAGINPADLFKGVKLSDPILITARSQAIKLFANLEQQAVDHFTTTDVGAVVDATVLALANKRRVDTAIRVFGSEENYYLCQGLGPQHFAAAAIGR